jgi:hypothetical protein
MADAICERIADGESLRTICEDEAMPGRTTVRRWLAERDDFRRQYALAREEQADVLFDEMLEIADDGTNDWMRRTGKDGEAGWAENGEHIRRSQVRIDARKWMAGKLRPKVYGDRQAIDHTVSLAETSNEELYARAKASAEALGLPVPDPRMFGLE